MILNFDFWWLNKETLSHVLYVYALFYLQFIQLQIVNVQTFSFSVRNISKSHIKRGYCPVTLMPEISESIKERAEWFAVKLHKEEAYKSLF